MEREIQKIEKQKRMAIAILPAMVVLLTISYSYINNFPAIPFLCGLFAGLLLNLCMYILFD
jgi:F0F1-type ATP synthase assembly protein I